MTLHSKTLLTFNGSVLLYTAKYVNYPDLNHKNRVSFIFSEINEAGCSIAQWNSIKQKGASTNQLGHNKKQSIALDFTVTGPQCTVEHDVQCRGRVSISELKRKKVELSATSIMAFKPTNYIHLDMLSYLEI